MQLLLTHCQVALSQHNSILLTLFLAGLVGGATHCIGMCGPFVVAQTNFREGCQTHLQKLSGAALLPYHFGRMTTYIVLGVIAAFLSKQIIGTPLQKGVSFLFLSVAGVIFIASALPGTQRLSGYFKFKWFARFGTALGKLATPLFANPKNIRSYALGVLLGFLPCGLIFASLMVVSTTGDVFAAILGMTLFTIGTFPSMFLVGIGGSLACRKWPTIMQIATRSVMTLNGFSLFILAGNIVF